MNLNNLAAYATILGTGVAIGAIVVGGIWRYWTWRQEHGTLVTVTLKWGGLTFGPNVVEAVTVTVLNQSSHPVRVTGAGVEINDGSERTGNVTEVKPGAGIPGVVAPHDLGFTWIEIADLKQNGFDPFKPARAFVHVADRTIWSKRTAVMRH